jgi:hypothetical protein
MGLNDGYIAQRQPDPGAFWADRSKLALEHVFDSSEARKFGDAPNAVDEVRDITPDRKVLLQWCKRD